MFDHSRFARLYFFCFARLYALFFPSLFLPWSLSIVCPFPLSHVFHAPLSLFFSLLLLPSCPLPPFPTLYSFLPIYLSLSYSPPFPTLYSSLFTSAFYSIFIPPFYLSLLSLITLSYLPPFLTLYSLFYFSLPATYHLFLLYIHSSLFTSPFLTHPFPYLYSSPFTSPFLPIYLSVISSPSIVSSSPPISRIAKIIE